MFDGDDGGERKKAVRRPPIHCHLRGHEDFLLDGHVLQLPRGGGLPPLPGLNDGRRYLGEQRPRFEKPRSEPILHRIYQEANRKNRSANPKRSVDFRVRRGPHTWIEIGELPPVAATGTEDNHKRAAAAAAARVEEVQRAAIGGEQEPRNGAERRRARGQRRRRKDGELAEHASAMLGLVAKPLNTIYDKERSKSTETDPVLEELIFIFMFNYLKIKLIQFTRA